VDGVAERLVRELVGYTDRVASIEAMRAAPDVHFVKTHRQRDADVDESDPAICLVRDGRDAVVSWARLLSEADPGRFEPQMRALIDDLHAHFLSCPDNAAALRLLGHSP